MQTFSTIYKRDSKGKIREWRMELEGNRYRTVAGLQDGQQVTSEWTECYAKNVGRANATRPEEQAQSEVESHYKKKLEGEYHKSIEDVDKPKWFKPMLAQPWEKRKGKMSYPCYYQSKIDGCRSIANSEGLWSRTGKEIVSCPHIWNVLKPLFDENPSLVLDGELYNHDLKNDFNEIISMVRKSKPKGEDLEKAEEMVQYHVYDMPMMDDTPFSERISDMVQLFIDSGIPHTNNDMTYGEYTSNIIHVMPTFECESMDDIEEHYARSIGDGYEGGIIRLDGPYEQKRSNNLIKKKDFEDEEFEIIGIEEGQGNWSGIAKVVVCRNNDGNEFRATIKGTREDGITILEEADEYIGKQVTVQFFTRTPDGVPRFPIAKTLYKDKRW